MSIAIYSVEGFEGVLGIFSFEPMYHKWWQDNAKRFKSHAAVFIIMLNDKTWEQIYILIFLKKWYGIYAG
jgi:hypothetical protein